MRTVDDLISRQDAIEAIFGRSHEIIKMRIENLPSAQKKGEWIQDRLVSTNGGTYGVRRCSNCENYYQDVGYGWNYCPNCGSDMRKEVE